MNIEELKKQAETEIADFIAQKIAELNKNTGKEVSEIRFTAREKMTGLEIGRASSRERVWQLV